MFIHHVYFWLNASAPREAQQQLVQDCLNFLGRIPDVKQIWAGTPAGTPRDVVDNSYHVALTVHLDDVAGHDAYQVHALHTQFIDRNKAHWDRVKIYDFITG